MQYRKFGSTDLSVSEIGFGAWAIGGPAMIGNTAIGWGSSNDTESIKSIHAALDAGINFFDTADIYGLGHSEELIGKVIGNKGDIIIATKVGNVARNNQFTTDYSRQYILSACESSLKRLNRNTIDYYQLHTARVEQLLQGECIDAMLHLQQQGKIRYWGLSLNTFEPGPEFSHLTEKNLGNGFQLVLNIINQQALPLLPVAGKNGYGIIARMPLQFGLLTGKFDKSSDFRPDDHRKNRLTREVIEATNNITKPVWDLCSKYNCSKTQLALSYILSYENVSTVIPGMRSQEQVALNTTNIFKLDEADRIMIEQLASTDFETLMQLIKKNG